MKKLLSLLCALSLAVFLIAGCSSQNEADSTEVDSVEAEEESVAADPVDVNVIALEGPTGMGLVYFMNEVDNGDITDNNYSFTLTSVTDEVTAALAQGTVDIAALPANLASVLYNNTDGGIQVLAINTLGVLYIVENGDTVSSIEDLAGKTIYASGKGSTPEYALNYILSANGIDPSSDVTIEWKSEHAECLAALLADEDGIAMLPQPFVTTALTQNDSLRVALDLTEEWDAIQADSDEPSALITGVVVARTEFVEENPDAVLAFLEHYQESVQFVNSNVEEAAQLVGQYGIVTEAIALQALPECNIVFIEGSEMKEKLSGYLAVLFEQNAQSVGGALPDDDFYYSR